MKTTPPKHKLKLLHVAYAAVAANELLAREPSSGPLTRDACLRKALDETVRRYRLGLRESELTALRQATRHVMSDANLAHDLKWLLEEGK